MRLYSGEPQIGIICESLENRLNKTGLTEKYRYLVQSLRVSYLNNFWQTPFS